MDIEVLRSFVVLATAKSYTAASRELYVSQPTLSRRVKQLEDELGCSLVNRTTPLTLTPMGSRLVGGMGNVIQAYDALLEEASAANGSVEKHISVQDNSLSPTFLGALVKYEERFLVAYPKVSFAHTSCPDGFDVYSSLRDGYLDICFVHTFSRFDDVINIPERAGFAFREFVDMRTQTCLAVKKNNPILSEVSDGSLPIACCRSLKFMSPLIRYLDDFRSAFRQYCLSEGGFSPMFDLRSAENHRYFYSEDPGQSAFILGKPIRGSVADGLIPSLRMEDLETVSIENCVSHTFAVISACEADPPIVEFANSLAR